MIQILPNVNSGDIIMKPFFSLSNSKGMTLIEAMVAILILSVGLIPVFVVILLANNFSATLKNNLIAANLAQEGIEVVRAVRDANWFTSGGVPFDRFLVDCGGPTTCIWRVEWSTSGPLLPLSSNPVLKIDSSGLYNYTSGTDTLFSRKITITKPAPGVELVVLVEVSWPERNRTQIVTAESHLYNWR